MKNEQIIKRIEKAEKDKKVLTKITDKTKLSTHDKVKLSLCRHFVQYAVENKLKLKQLAKLCNIEPTRISEIVNYKISKFTVDQLLKDLTSLAKNDDKIKEYLKLFEQVAEVPTLKVDDTKKISERMHKAVRTFSKEISL